MCLLSSILQRSISDKKEVKKAAESVDWPLSLTLRVVRVLWTSLQKVTPQSDDQVQATHHQFVVSEGGG